MAPTLETIAAAINLIETKKDSLKAAYDELQFHSSLLSSSVSLSWSDIDAYFSSVQVSLSDRLSLLESLESGPPNHSGVESVPTRTGLASAAVTRTESVVSRPELRYLCENMDGNGLIKYIMDHTEEREAIRIELAVAMQCALDPASMVLDAIEGFGSENSSTMDAAASPRLTRVFVLLLEQLMETSTDLSFDVRERAKKIAFDWKLKAGSDGNKHLEALGFLHLVAAYGLGPEFDMNELMDYFVVISRYKQATSLCKKIVIGDKVADLIQKLLDRGKLVLAVKFVFEFQMTGRFQPVTILKSYLKESKMAAQKVCKEGNNSVRAQNEAADKEVSFLKAVIRIVEEHKLEPEISKESLEKCIEEIEKRKAERKHPSHTVNAAKLKQQQRGNKRPRVAAIGPPLPKPLFQPAGLLPDLSASYLSSQVGPYGLVSSNPGVVPYTGSSSAGLYGSAGPAGHQLYTPESQTTSSYYDRQTAYSEYGLPSQYHSAYHPR